MPGLIKIGKTEQNADVRMSQLYTSGVPVPFKCVIAVKTELPAAKVERALHRAFHPQRLNPRREFFQIEPDQVVAVISLLGEDVTNQVNASDDELTDSDRAAGERAEKRLRRPTFDFEQMKIPVGSVLQFANSDNETEVEVVDGRKVKMGDDVVYMSEATRRALEVEYAVGPLPYWTYEGRLLSDIYDETYGTPPEQIAS